ncbi:MAG: hypothetical protein R2717_01620 [Schumannella sp.]
MFKKLFAGLITAVLSLGVVALVASPASAHHNTIKPKVTCAVDGAYTVTWSVTNSESNKTEVITASNMPDVVPVGTSLGFNETKTFIQTVTEPQNLELVLTGFWDGDTSTTKDDVYSQNSGWWGKDSFPTGCIKVTPEATSSPSVCTGPNQFSAPSYTLKDVTGVVYKVDGVVTAPGTYPATNGTTVNITAEAANSKYKITGTSSWKFTFTEPELCTVEVQPVEPDFQKQVCTGPGQHKLAQYFIPDTTGVIYSVKINGTETVTATGWYDVPDGVTAVQIIARADEANYYRLKGGDSAKIYDYTVDQAGSCLTEVLPKTPTVSNDTCNVDVAPGVVPPSTYTLYYVEHVVYEVSTDGVTYSAVPITADTTFTVAAGTHLYVKATVDDTTKYQAAPFSYDYQFVDRGDCKAKVRPVEPKWANGYCDDSDVLVDAGPGAAVSSRIVAAASSRFVASATVTIFPADNVTYYLDGVLVAPGTYDVTPGPHTVTVTYDTTKYTLAAGVSLPFEGTVSPGECIPLHPPVTPAVSSNQIGCFSSGSYTLGNDLTDADAVIWTVNGSQVAQGKYTAAAAGTVSITATANTPDYVFADGVQTSWTVDFKKPAVCDTETLAYTGQSPMGLLVAADAFMVAGLAMFATRSARRRSAKLTT